MQEIVLFIIQLVTTIWAIFIGTLVFTGLNLAALVALPFPKKLREKIFFVPVPFLMQSLFRVGTLSRLSLSDKRSRADITNQKGKSVLYIANHRSMVDPPFLNGKFPITTLMKFEVLYIPFLTLPSFSCGAITVKRGDRDSRKNALIQSLARLDSGQAVFYFPEGTRAKEKSIKEFKDIHLPLIKAAYEKNVAVVPITVTGTKELLGKHNLVIPFSKMGMITHNYVYPKDFSSDIEFAQFCWEKVCSGLTEEN